MDPRQVTRDSRGTMRCGECGFIYDLDRGGVIARSSSGLEDVRAALESAPESIRGTRPQPSVWSVNAYTSHLADAAEVILARVRSIAEEDQPQLAWHDQDAAVEEQRGDEISADESFSRLSTSVASFVAYLRALPDTAWQRAGIHSRAGKVRFSEIAQDMPHELSHHAMDIRRVGSPRR